MLRQRIFAKGIAGTIFPSLWSVFFLVAIGIFQSSHSAFAADAELLSCEGEARVSLRAAAWLRAEAGQKMAVRDRLRTLE